MIVKPGDSIKHAARPFRAGVIPKCPTCGKLANIYRAVAVSGKAKLVWNLSGLLQPPRIRDLNFRPHSQTIRCTLCKKIRRDIEEINGEVVIATPRGQAEE